MELLQFRKVEREVSAVAAIMQFPETSYVTQYRTRLMMHFDTEQNLVGKLIDLYTVSEEWTDWQDMP